MGGIAPVTRAVGHESMPELGDRVGSEASGRRSRGESEAGQRRGDDCERVRRITAVRGGVAQQGEDLEVLARRSGPAVCQREWQRLRATPGCMDEVHELAAEIGLSVVNWSSRV